MYTYQYINIYTLFICVDMHIHIHPAHTHVQTHTHIYIYDDSASYVLSLVEVVLPQWIILRSGTLTWIFFKQTFLRYSCRYLNYERYVKTRWYFFRMFYLPFNGYCGHVQVTSLIILMNSSFSAISLVQKYDL